MKLSKINLLLISLVAGAALFLPAANVAWAQSTLPDLLPACAETGACRICDIVGIFITLGRWLIAGAGALALLVIVFAGSNIVTSAGNSEKVGAAKKQIVGAVLGLGLVLVAFQLVSFIIFALTTPAADQNFDTSKNPSAKTKGLVSLSTFLGIPWWQICDQSELLDKGSQNNGKGLGYPSTGSCAFWGDGTACTKDGAKKCCKGICTADKCETQEIIAPVIQGKPPIISPSDTAIPTCPLLNTQDENSVRDCLGKAGIKVVTINYRTLVAGLSRDTIEKLIKASSFCNFQCIVITGAMEKAGHVANTSHGNPNVVDIDINSQNANTVIDALKSVGLQQLKEFPGTPSGWFVCDETGKAKVCGLASHLHAQF